MAPHNVGAGLGFSGQPSRIMLNSPAPGEPPENPSVPTEYHIPDGLLPMHRESSTEIRLMSECVLIGLRRNAARSIAFLTAELGLTTYVRFATL